MIYELKQGIAKELKKISDAQINFNSNVQNTKIPCFFIFLIDKPQVRGVGGRRYYEIQFDIVYTIQEYQNDEETQLTNMSDALDNIDMIDYIVKENDEYITKAQINIIGANPEINDNELHYKINMRLDYLLVDESEVVEDTEYELIKGE